MEIQLQLSEIEKFVKSFYTEKDIMHDFSHIERISVVLNDLVPSVKLKIDQPLVEAALYFHGIIYSHEPEIRQFLQTLKLPKADIDKIIQVAWESQKENKPATNEGLLLHDAHMLEGGRNFEIIKSLITGSVRGQSLEETMQYIEKHLLHKGFCYTDEGVKRYEITKRRTKEIFDELNEGLGRK